MAKVGGARPGAGRPKGSVSKRHAEVLAAAASEGITPVEYMLQIMHGDEFDAKSRAWAAEKAAPYIHPRPAPVARTIKIDLPDTKTVEGVKDAIARITAAAASGKISPSEAQSMVSVIEAQRKAIETGELWEEVQKLKEAVNRRGAA